MEVPEVEATAVMRRGDWIYDTKAEKKLSTWLSVQVAKQRMQYAVYVQ